MEETYHVTFSEDDEAISQSNIEGNIKHFPYIPTYDPLPTNNINIHANNITPTYSPILQDSVSPKEPSEFIIVDDHPALNEPGHPELVDALEPAELQDFVINKPISKVQPSSTTITPTVEVNSQPPGPQDRWSREKHIELVDIIGKPLAGVTTRSRIRDCEAASAHECLYVNFLSEIEPKKLIEALEKEG
ncbi:hypothetical protein Tco_1353467 [Tanacetum coccineum]